LIEKTQTAAKKFLEKFHEEEFFELKKRLEQLNIVMHFE